MGHSRAISFRLRILICYLICATIFLAATLIYSSRETMLREKQEQLEQLHTLTLSANSMVSSLVYDLTPVLYFHVNNPRLCELLLADDGQSPEATHRSILEIEQDIVRQSRYIVSIYLENAAGDAVAIHSLDEENYGDMGRYLAQATVFQGKTTFCEPFTSAILPVYSLVLPVSRVMVDTRTGQYLGKMLLLVDFDQFVKQIEASTGQHGLNSTIILNDQIPIYATRDLQFYDHTVDVEHFARNYLAEDGTTQLHLSREMISSVVNAQTDWTVAKYQIIHDPYALIYQNFRTFLVFEIGLFAIVLVLGVIFTNRTTRQIRLLLDTITTSDGFYPKLVDERKVANDEVGRLILTYNQMVRDMRESVEREYHLRLAQREADLRNLRFQINPHFLYNSLNTISSIAELQDAPEIREISSILSKLFRYSTKGSDFVTIGDELDNVRNYLKIQSYRYTNRLTFDIICDPGLDHYSCVRFILQPLVENAFIHGASRQGRICLEIRVFRLSQEEICIEVWDKGKGIEAERLAELNAVLSAPEQLEDIGVSVGILNVHGRIRHYFGPPYGLAVQSAVGEYTLVRIRLPGEELVE